MLRACAIESFANANQSNKNAKMKISWAKMLKKDALLSIKSAKMQFQRAKMSNKDAQKP